MGPPLSGCRSGGHRPRDRASSSLSTPQTLSVSHRRSACPHPTSSSMSMRRLFRWRHAFRAVALCSVSLLTARRHGCSYRTCPSRRLHTRSLGSGRSCTSNARAADPRPDGAAPSEPRASCPDASGPGRRPPGPRPTGGYRADLVRVWPRRDGDLDLPAFTASSGECAFPSDVILLRPVPSSKQWVISHPAWSLTSSARPSIVRD
jgi:hypothetical protein